MAAPTDDDVRAIVKQFLKENLSVRLDIDTMGGWSDSEYHKITVSLLLDGQEIASDYGSLIIHHP